MSRRASGALERGAVLLLAALVVVWLISRVSFWAGAILGLALLPVLVVAGAWSYVGDLRPPRRTGRRRSR